MLINNFTVTDIGVFSSENVDYVRYAQTVAHKIADNAAEFGILCCGSGVGVNIAANRICGVRAVRCGPNDHELVRIARQHNDVNIITFGANFITSQDAVGALKIFFQTAFLKLSRYQRRNKMLDQ